MKKKFSIKYEIGDWVIANSSVSFGYDDIKVDGHWRSGPKRIMFRYKQSEPITGQFIGARFRNLGIRKSGEWDGEPASFKCTKRVLVYQIKTGVMKTPIEVLPKDTKKATIMEKIKGEK